MQGIFQKENTDKVLKYGIYRHLPTYEKIIRNLVSFYSNQIVEFIDLLNQVELGGKVDENKASSNGAVSYCTIYFVIDETLTIIPGEYFKIGDTFYEFDNYDELWDKFIVFNSIK